VAERRLRLLVAAQEHRASERDPAHPVRALPSPQYFDRNRRDLGQSQSKWAPHRMETAGSPGRQSAREDLRDNEMAWGHP
jgi:hypothetical protein